MGKCRRSAAPVDRRRSTLVSQLVALLALGVSGVAETTADETPDLPTASTTPAPGASPAVHSSFSLGPTFDAEILRDLPLGHTLWSAFETVDPTALVDRMENGGMYAGEPGLLGIRGSSWTQASWTLGDLDITDPDRTGTPLLLVDPEVLEAIEVAAGLMPADQGGAGPAVTLTVRRPGDSWRRVLQADVVPPGLQQANQATRTSGVPAIARYDSFSSGRFRLDGPLVKDRVGLLVSGTFARSRRLERADPRSLLGRELGLLTHLVWTPTARDEARFLGAFQGTLHPYAGRARLGGGDVRQADRFLHVQSTWQRRGTRPWSLTGGFARGAFDPDLDGRATASDLARPAVVERLRDGPLPQLYPGRSSRQRLTFAGWMDPLLDEHHAMRVGLSLAWARSSTRPEGTLGLTPESVYGLPARVWEYGWAGPESRWGADDLSAYAMDRITYGRLSLDAGLRFESTSASGRGSSGRIGWHSLSPRLSARVRLTPGDGLVFFTGYARYRHRLPLNLLAFGDPTAAQGLVYRWLDGNGDGAFEPSERGPLVARMGPGGAFSSIDPGLRPPRSWDVVVGFQGRIAGTWTVRGLGYHRRERNLVASVDVGAPASAYDLGFVPHPGKDVLRPEDDQLLPIYDRRPESFGLDRYVLTNAGDAMDEGVEVSIRGSIGKRLRFLAGGTASRSLGDAANRGFLAVENDHGLVGERLEEPNATTFSRGRLFFERGYTLGVAASYRAPRDLRFGAVARYQDGQHYPHFVIAPDLRQGPEPIQGLANGRWRFTFVLTVDARVEKGFTVGGARVAAILEAFNLRGTAIEVEQDPTTGLPTRDDTAVQPPRALRLGVRVDF